MTEADLDKLIAHHEADRVEFTVSTTNTDKFSEAICAFSNDLPRHEKPGYLLIGVNDEGGYAGLQLSDEFLRNLGAIRDDGNIQPRPSIAVEKVTTDRGDVAIVTVQPSPLPPVRYKGRVWIRIGPRRAYASEHEESLLIERRVAHAKTFDAQPCFGSAIEDIALPVFLNDYRTQAVASEVIRENHRTVEHQLASLRFFDLRKGCPTNAGIVLFGLDLRKWLSGAYVQFIRVDGDTLAGSVLAEREIVGDLLTVLRQLDALIDAQLQQAPVARTTLREGVTEWFPRIAVRELLMNAVMHRDYDSTAPLRVTWLADRLEIQSPGGLYGEVSEANFPMQTSYRNPVIAEAMKTLGYVNRYGRGVLRAQEALHRNGNPPAEFRFDAGFVLAVIRGVA